MDSSKYDRSVSLMCSTCGHTGFEYDENNPTTMRCVGCDRVFTREELMQENGELIEAEADAMKAEVIKDLEKEFRSIFQSAFGNSKHFRIK